MRNSFGEDILRMWCHTDLSYLKFVIQGLKKSSKTPFKMLAWAIREMNELVLDINSIINDRIYKFKDTTEHLFEFLLQQCVHMVKKTTGIR